MNNIFLVKNYLIENERKVNDILRWFPLVFLILCPAVLVMKQAGVIEFEFSFIVGLCIGIVVLCVFPLIFSRYSYHESWNRAINLIVIEFFICVLAVSDAIHVSIMYAFVPMLALLYVDPAVFINTARNCFISMLLIEIGKLIYHYQISVKQGVSYQGNYMELVALVIEYVILMFAMYYLLQHFETMVSSGYKIQNRGDGTFAIAASAIQEQVEESYNTKGLFLDVTHRVESMTQGQTKKLVSVIDDELPSQLKGDTEKVKLMLINILSDFVQYTETGEVQFEVSYEKGITPKKGQDVTIVCKIQCNQDLSEDLRYGNALGFALGKNMLQKLNGVILNKSGGNPFVTQYVISFRQTVDSAETLRQMRSSRKREQDMLIAESRKKAENLMYVKAGKALIVDDNEMNQKLVAAILKSYGLDSICVSSGDEAVEVVQSKEFNLIILDYMMPVKGGLQIAKEIRQLGDKYYEELPLIAMTSNNTEESKMMFYDNRFAEVISKPIKEDELRLAIALCMCL